MNLTLSLSLALFIGVSARASEPGASGSLRVFPQQVQLESGRDYQRIIVQEVFPDGSTLDRSESATLTIENSSVCELVDGYVIPRQDGQTQLLVKIGEKQHQIPVVVQGSQNVPALSFRNDVLAVLTHAGCNTGKCHGSASGKDGFRLSLFGYDPEGDHFRLTREMNGRRINLADPESSLMIQKAIGEVAHTGGQCILPDTPDYRVLISWLQSGALGDDEKTPVPVGITVGPEQIVFSSSGRVQELTVLARYSDGTDRDVTSLAVFLSNNDAVATVTEDGFVTSTGAGGAFVMARFDQFTSGAHIITRPGTDYRFPELSTNNYVDEHVFRKWRTMHLLPSDLCSDEVFLRRVYLDLIGLLPTAQQQEEFLNSKDPNKREAVVDRLLQEPAFKDMWIMKWAEMLQIRSVNGIAPKGLLAYDRWLRNKIHSGQTIDEVVREVLCAKGGTLENPATTYFQTETTAQLLAENVAQAFLGTRIQCAQCHNHPFDRWTMDDYYGFATFFSRVGYKQAQDPREVTIYDMPTGNLPHPIADREVIPTYLGGGSPQQLDITAYRSELAQWLTSKENKDFSRNLANVVWAHFNGIGIVEPVDDFRISNPPSNPELLDALAEHLVNYEFDISRLAKDICLSRTYQLSTEKNESNRWDHRNFSHASIRRLRAEVLLDCINEVTETEEEFPGLPNGGRAIEIPDGRAQHYFLNTFGRASRQTACSCEVQTSPTLSQSLHLINGESTTGKIDEGRVIERLMQKTSDPLQVVEQLYRRTLCRAPTRDESRAIRLKLANSDLEQGLKDLFWALLNSNEFIFNH